MVNAAAPRFFTRVSRRKCFTSAHLVPDQGSELGGRDIEGEDDDTTSGDSESDTAEEDSEYILGFQ